MTYFLRAVIAIYYERCVSDLPTSEASSIHFHWTLAAVIVLGDRETEAAWWQLSMLMDQG